MSYSTAIPVAYIGVYDLDDLKVMQPNEDGAVFLFAGDNLRIQFPPPAYRGVTPHDVAGRLRELADEIDGWSTDLIVCQGCGQELAAMSETCMCPVGDLIRLKEPA